MNVTPRNSSSSYETERQIWREVAMEFSPFASIESDPESVRLFSSRCHSLCNHIFRCTVLCIRTKEEKYMYYLILNCILTVVRRNFSLKWSTNIRDNTAISLFMSPFTPSWTSPPTSLFLPDSEVMRAVIDQLFQQEMRGHLSEACLNSQ